MSVSFPCLYDDDAFYLFLQKQKIALKPYTPPLGTSIPPAVLPFPPVCASDADSGENSGELDAGEPDAAEQDKEWVICCLLVLDSVTSTP